MWFDRVYLPCIAASLTVGWLWNLWLVAQFANKNSTNLWDSYKFLNSTIEIRGYTSSAFFSEYFKEEKKTFRNMYLKRVLPLILFFTFVLLPIFLFGLEYISNA